jgi:predicted metal-dependent hydrolase
MFGFKDKTINDPQLGEILFRKNQRARKYIIRIKANAVSVTIPQGGTYAEASAFFKKNRTLVIQKTEEIKAKKETSPKKETPLHNESELRRQAKAVLPQELEQLAKKYGFQYQSVKIRKSKTRWGSCSSKKTISLSLYLMLLPPHLIEYVLLHELCHTIHMNHSPAFWALLDKSTGNKAKELRKELRTINN